MAGGIKLDLKGFAEYAQKVQDAGASVDATADIVIRSSANIMKTEYQTAMASTGTSGSLIGRMPAPEIEKSGNKSTAFVGYHKGAYVPNNISDGYKAVFLNYGTPRIKPRKFIDMAKKSAKPKIRKDMQKVIDEVVERLK